MQLTTVSMVVWHPVSGPKEEVHAGIIALAEFTKCCTTGDTLLSSVGDYPGMSEVPCSLMKLWEEKYVKQELCSSKGTSELGGRYTRSTCFLREQYKTHGLTSLCLQDSDSSSSTTGLDVPFFVKHSPVSWKILEASTTPPPLTSTLCEPELVTFHMSCLCPWCHYVLSLLGHEIYNPLGRKKVLLGELIVRVKAFREELSGRA